MLQGLAYINKEGLDAITTVIHELEQAGYVTRAKVRNEKGQLREMEYTDYSSPKLNDDYSEKPVSENQRNRQPSQGFTAVAAFTSLTWLFGVDSLEKA